MLSANGVNKTELYAFECDKDDGPFICPECRQDLILKKCRVRVDHFSHYPGSDIECNYTSEGVDHMFAKRDIFLFLRAKKKIKNLALEKKIVGNFGKYMIADLYFERKGKRIAIEIQKSGKDFDDIRRKTQFYSSLGIYVLWVYPMRMKDHERFDLDDDEYFTIPKVMSTMKYIQGAENFCVWEVELKRLIEISGDKKEILSYKGGDFPEYGKRGYSYHGDVVGEFKINKGKFIKNKYGNLFFYPLVKESQRIRINE